MKIHQLSVLCLLILSLTSSAQIAQFGLRNSLGINANPARTGLTSNPEVNYGLGLYNLNLSQPTYMHILNGSMYVDQLHGGIGLQVSYSDVFGGYLKSKSFFATYAYPLIQNDELLLSIGGGAGLFQEKTAFDILSLPPGEYLTRYISFRANYGALFTYKNFFLEAVQHYVSFRTITNDRIDVFAIQLQGGHAFSPFKNKNLVFTNFLRYDYQEGFQSLTIASNFKTNHFALGLSYAPNEIFGLMAGVRIGPIWVNYAHYIDDSKLSNYGISRDELVVKYTIRERLNTANKNVDFFLF
jgi:hypothetical protein